MGLASNQPPAHFDSSRLPFFFSLPLDSAPFFII